tara:strand:- start:10 stop:789 length:780 start_codon:yes stop_codon:yes gene_type:complete
MALPSSGQLSLNQLHVEAGGTTGTQASMNDSDIRGLIDKGSGAQNKISEYYGASNTPAVTEDFTTQIGTTNNAVYYLQAVGDNYAFNDTTTNMHYDIAYNASGNTYSTFGAKGANGGPPSPAVIEDSDGHGHTQVAFMLDLGDGYVPGNTHHYWKANSGGRILGDGTSGDWGEMEVYVPLSDYLLGDQNGNGPAGAPNGSLNNNQGYVDLIAHSYSSGTVNATTVGDGIPYQITSDISLLLGIATGSLGSTLHYHADIT